MLDKNKPYGEVCGACPFKYEQGGKFFNAEGKEVNADGKLKRAVKPKDVS